MLSGFKAISERLCGILVASFGIRRPHSAIQRLRAVHFPRRWSMARKFLLILFLSVSLTAICQTDATSNPATQSPAVPAVVSPSVGGSVWTGIGPAGGVLLSTPSAAFDTPQPTAGISVAGRAGISNSTPINTGLQNTLSPSSMVYVYPTAMTAPVASPVTENPATEAVSTERATDFGPSSFVASIGAPPAAGLSLAEVAAMYKARKGTQALRTYTNADVPRENAGLLTNISMASNMPPAPPQSSKPQPSSAPAATSQSQPTSQQPETSTQSAAGNNPQPAQNQSEEENKGLPASSTVLPLLGLLGVASAGIGLWYRRRIR